jgi:hypothetical protein
VVAFSQNRSGSMASISSVTSRKSGSSAAGSSPTKNSDRSSSSKTYMFSPARGLDDSSPVFNLLRCLKAAWPSREAKKADRENKKKRSKHSSARALELQLQLHQERICCEWNTMNVQAGWRMNRAIDPYRPFDQGLPDQVQSIHNQNINSSLVSPRLNSIYPSPTLQAAK